LAVPSETDTVNFWIDNGGYYFDKIIILTDGTCGSACAYFATKMKVDQKAYLVSTGGVVGQPMDIAAFAGGNVEDWQPYLDDVNYYLTQNGLTMQNQLKYLPTSAREIFGLS
jgi:hypothetical protein